MKRFCILAALAVASVSHAEITYTVNVLRDAGTLHVVMTLPNAQKGTKLQLPNWAPGAYRLNDSFKNVLNLKAYDESGKPLKIDTVMETVSKSYQDGADRKTVENSICTWVLPGAKTATVEYDVATRPTDGAVSWSGPSTYLYSVDRRKEKCTLQITSANGWNAYTGLDETKPNTNNFTAKDYDTLADNPVTMGDVTVDTYTSRGKPHFIVMYGKARAKVDRAYLMKACKFVSDMQTDFFGGKAPYNKYVWHFNVNDAADGAGGLEHLSSTQIGLAAGVGPRAVSVLSHEFFHLWNVKRIRSKPLGPFDYTKLPQTGALWWLEGVTDYYANTLLHRYGWVDETSYFGSIASNVTSVRRNATHTEVSPNDSSLRVDEASGGRGNSNGYRISYYNQGWIGGMVLDIELRSQSGGKYDLDDVEHALWNLCKDGKPGFEETEIRRQLVRLGGASMGDFYDKVIMNPGEMAIDETLAKVGLMVARTPESYTDNGFVAAGGFGPGGPAVNAISGPAVGKLQMRDVILGVNGTPLAGTTGRELMTSMTAALAGSKPGVPLTLSIKRGEETLEVTVTPISASRDIFSIARLPNATDEQKKLGKQWMAQRIFKA